MPIKLKEITTLMESIAPTSYAEKWDNCGLLVGDREQIVNKILLSIDPTMEVIDYAIEENIDLIITHHPVTIGSFNRITNDTVLGKKLIKVIKHNIALYSAHTNLDRIGKSINHILANKIGLCHWEVLEPFTNSVGLKKDEDGQLGYGLIGEISKPICLIDFVHHVKNVLALDYVHYTGKGTELIKKVAIASGSGMDFANCAMEKNADILITGDLKYHNAIETYEKKLLVIDATHFGTERVVVDVFFEQLKKPMAMAQVEIIKDQQSKNPIKLCQ